LPSGIGNMESPMVGKMRKVPFLGKFGKENLGSEAMNSGSLNPALYPAFAFTGTYSTFSFSSRLTVIAKTRRLPPLRYTSLPASNSRNFNSPNFDKSIFMKVSKLILKKDENFSISSTEGDLV